MAKFYKGMTPWNKGLKVHLNPAFEWKKGHKSWNKGMKGYQSGKKHYHWKGGRKITGRGYIYIYKPEHPYCSKQKYVAKSRLVAEKYLNRYLTKFEVIHHIDENPLNNSIKNLYLFDNRWKHCVYHRFVNCGKIKPITKSNLIPR